MSRHGSPWVPRFVLQASQLPDVLPVQRVASAGSELVVVVKERLFHGEPMLQSLLQNLAATSTLHLRIEKFVADRDRYFESLENEVSVLRSVLSLLMSAFARTHGDSALAPLHALSEVLPPIIHQIDTVRPCFPMISLEGIPGLIPLPGAESEGASSSSSRVSSLRSLPLPPSPASGPTPHSHASAPPIELIDVSARAEDDAEPAL